MRLRLVHTLSLLLVAATLLAVAGMGGVLSWNLRRGFADVLAARDADRLEQFARLVARQAEASGGADALSQHRLDMRALLEAFAAQEGSAGILPPGARRLGPPPPRRADDRPAPPPRGPDGAFPPGPPPLNDDAGPAPDPGPGRRPMPGETDVFADRVVIVDLAGQPLLGRPLPAGPAPAIERPVVVGGRIVAKARLEAGLAVPDAVGARFLRRQELGIVAVALALVALAASGGWWTARRFARPLQAVQAATSRIARGELSARVEGDGGRRGDEIGDVVRNVNRMAESLQRLEGARRRWVADLSHELRTPLAVLRGEIEALQDGVRPLRAEAMGSLHEEVRRLSALVDDLHLLAMADLDALPCHPSPTEPGTLLAAVATRFAGRAAGAGLALEIATPDEGPEVRWDPGRVEQLLGNLVENAVRYTDEPGRVVMSWRWDRTRLGDRVLLVVEDTAPGVAAADLPRLFEPLWRADAARSRHHGGSGLGLAIVEAIARSHGGRVTASASPLGGLRVEVDLPLAVREDRAR